MVRHGLDHEFFECVHLAPRMLMVAVGYRITSKKYDWSTRKSDYMPRKNDYCPLGLRLLEVIKGKNFDRDADFAASLGISSQTLSAYMIGKSQPKYNFLEQIVRDFGINAHWLLTGEGEMFRSATYRRENGMLVGEASKATATLGPVAERVDGIERAAPGMGLPDLLPFVIKNLRAWYAIEVEKMPGEQALEPPSSAYAQEDQNPNPPPERPGDRHTRD